MTKTPNGATSTQRPRALVIGGSGGIGAEICNTLAGEGWDVLLSYRSNKDAARDVSQRLATAHQCSAELVQLDLGFPEEVKDILNVSLGARPLHTVIYSAGPYVPQKYVSTIEWKKFQEVMQQDALGFFALVEACLPRLRETSGSIVAVTSTAVGRYAKRDVLSAAPKASVEALVRAIATEEGRYGIRANCVGVGVIEGGLSAELVRNGELTQEVLEKIRLELPLRRFGSVGDVAKAVMFLATSAQSGWITGQSLYVDGGHCI